MNHFKTRIILLAACLGISSWQPPVFAGELNPPLITSEGFSVPQPGHPFVFPRDHGSHPDFKVEWWYITGHLFDDRARRYGFQATFFRFAELLNQASNSAPEADSLFGNAQLHLAHMALLDATDGKFIFEERLNREGWDAAATTNTLDVRNGNWSLRFDGLTSNSMALKGSIRGEAAFALELKPLKPLVVFGKNGVSRKGSSPVAASYYLTFPRLAASGEIILDGQSRPVHGQAWMDHEISSSQLDDTQSGWDWAGIQLNDGREIMTYRLRKRDGTTDTNSSLGWVDAQGTVTNLTSAQFSWSADGRWQSPQTGAAYPLHATILTTDPASQKPVTLILEPLFSGQELGRGVGDISYWEGACRVLDAAHREIGSAYLELTGYAGRNVGDLK